MMTCSCIAYNKFLRILYRILSNKQWGKVVQMNCALHIVNKHMLLILYNDRIQMSAIFYTIKITKARIFTISPKIVENCRDTVYCIINKLYNLKYILS